MRLLFQEAKLDRMDLQWALLGPSSLKVYCVFECEVPEQGAIFLLENSGSEETLFPHHLDKVLLFTPLTPGDRDTACCLHAINFLSFSQLNSPFYFQSCSLLPPVTRCPLPCPNYSGGWHGRTSCSWEDCLFTLFREPSASGIFCSVCA